MFGLTGKGLRFIFVSSLVGLSATGCAGTSTEVEKQFTCVDINLTDGFSFTAQQWKPSQSRVIGFGQFTCNQTALLESNFSLKPNAAFEVTQWYYSLSKHQEKIGLLKEISDLNNFGISAKPITESIVIPTGKTVQIFGVTEYISASESGSTPVTDLFVPLEFRSETGQKNYSIKAKASIGVN